MNIVIDGIEYIVVACSDICGKPGRKEMKLRRKKGKRLYFAVVYENGEISGVV